MGNPFRDQRVRHAMALAINERMLMRISRNMYQPAGTIVAPGPSADHDPTRTPDGEAPRTSDEFSCRFQTNPHNPPSAGFISK